MTTIGVSGRIFLLVSAHPGCPEQNPESCKQFCVCACGMQKVDHVFVNLATFPCYVICVSRLKLMIILKRTMCLTFS